jgi:hypothetical protein
MDSIDPYDEILPKIGLENKTKKSINIFNYITLNSVIKVILLIFLVSMIVPLWYWITSDDSILVQPIVVGEFGKDQNLRQEPITDLLIFDLNRIRDIYAEESVSVNNKSIPSNNVFILNPKENSEITSNGGSNLGQLGIISIAGTSLPLGQMLLCSKELTHHRGRIITGSLQRYGSNLTLITLLINDSSDNSQVKAYKVSRTLIMDNIGNTSYEEHIPGMIEELAFKIANDIFEENRLPKLERLQTWQAFRNLTFAREAYNLYRITGDSNILDSASEKVLLAKRSEPYCSEPDRLISELSLAYMDIGEYAKSLSLMENISQS